MPNWCENLMKVTGPEEEVKKFAEEYILPKKGMDGVESDEGFDFDRVIPEPRTIEECPERYRVMGEQQARQKHLAWDPEDPTCWFDWYNWRLDHWGCKWKLSDEDHTIDTEEIQCWFNTPWGPPMPVMQELQDRHPNLEISIYWLEEGGNCGYLKGDGTEDAGYWEKGGEVAKIVANELGYDLEREFEDEEEENENE